MKINCNNIIEIEKIHLHDFSLINLDYNAFMEKISMNIVSNSYEKKNIELIFNNISFFKVQNAYFWENINRVDISSIWYNKDKKELKKLVEEFNAQNNDKEYISPKINNGFLEVGIRLLNGGEIIIICKELIVNEI